MGTRGIGTALAVIALGAAAVGGCGGAQSLSRAALTTRADAICKQRAARVAAIEQRSRGDARTVLAMALPVASRSVGELRALKPPANLQRTYDEFIAGQRAEVDRIAQNLAALRSGQRSGLTPESHALRARRGRITEKLGFTSCA